jgi:threonine/homoserine/homoserine lactone efflux protein
MVLPLEHLPAFFAAALTINLTPGPNVTFVIAKCLTSGFRAAVPVVLGVGAGLVVYTLLASVGAAAALTAWPALYVALRVAGALFLLWLGWRAWSTILPSSAEAAATAESGRALFGQGIANTLLNPQVGVFFLMFLPQFTTPARGSLTWQLAFLGLCFVTSGTLVNLGYAAIAARASRGLARTPGRLRAIRRVGAAALLVLGIWLSVDVLTDLAA